mgnify:CR=1 FL=1
MSERHALEMDDARSHNLPHTPHSPTAGGVAGERAGETGHAPILTMAHALLMEELRERRHSSEERAPLLTPAHARLMEELRERRHSSEASYDYDEADEEPSALRLSHQHQEIANQLGSRLRMRPTYQDLVQQSILVDIGMSPCASPPLRRGGSGDLPPFAALRKKRSSENVRGGMGRRGSASSPLGLGLGSPSTREAGHRTRTGSTDAPRPDASIASSPAPPEIPLPAQIPLTEMLALSVVARAGGISPLAACAAHAGLQPARS